MIAMVQPMAVIAPSQMKKAHHWPRVASTTPGASDNQLQA